MDICRHCSEAPGEQHRPGGEPRPELRCKATPNPGEAGDPICLYDQGENKLVWSLPACLFHSDLQRGGDFPVVGTQAVAEPLPWRPRQGVGGQGVADAATGESCISDQGQMKRIRTPPSCSASLSLYEEVDVGQKGQPRRKGHFGTSPYESQTLLQACVPRPPRAGKDVASSLVSGRGPDGFVPPEVP